MAEIKAHLTIIPSMSPRTQHRPAILPGPALRLAILLAMFAAGCSSNARLASSGTADVLHAGRLFVSANPYRSMLVEIDAVEGGQLAPATVDAIRVFLHGYCDKPDGITLRCNPPYPVADARNASSCTYLALTHGQGPPASSRTAYLHIVVYDSRYFAHAARDGDNPRFVTNPYPALIYLDRAYWRGDQRDLEKVALLHEVGHALGLATNRAHGDGIHCADRDCLMYWQVGVSRFRKFFGIRPIAPDKDLCPRCKADLAAARASPPGPAISFVGACFIRREQGYWVASLPGALLISFDQTRRPDSDELARDAAEWHRGRTGADDFFCRCYFPDNPRAPQTLAAIDRAKRDAAWQVRECVNDPRFAATTRPTRATATAP